MACATVLRETFAKVQPVCIQLAQHQSIEDLSRLRETLLTLDKVAVGDLHEYILFPLRLTLKKYGAQSENQCIICLSCLKQVLSSCIGTIDNLSLYQDLFSTLCCLISLAPTAADEPLTVAKTCDEIKLETVQCLSKLLAAASYTVIAHFYRAESVPLLGHAVTVLLGLARHESMRKLRVEALNCLVNIACCNRSDMTGPCGDLFAAFLPGIVSSLTAIVTGDPKQGHTVTCAAITAFRNLVCLVLADANLETAAVHHTSLASGSQLKGENRGSDQSLKSANLVVRRTKEWAESTSEKLSLVIEKVTVVATDSHWKVRLSMVELAESILLNCTKSLQRCAMLLIDVLVRATTDEYNSTVATKSCQVLEQFSTLRLQEDARPIIEILQDNVFSLAGRLPVCLSAADDAKKLATIQLLRGYVQLLGSRIDVVLRSSVHLHRLSTALMDVLQFDCSIIQIIEERSTGTSYAMIKEAETVERSRYHFKCFINVAIELEIVSICRLLGYYGNLTILVDHFFELFVQTALYRKQAAYCLKEIIRGMRDPPAYAQQSSSAQKYEATELESLVRSFLEEYLQPKYWDLPVTGQMSSRVENLSTASLQVVSRQTLTRSAPSESSRSVEQINSNIILICLLLDGIEQCSLLLGTKFQLFLMDVLYPLLDKIGSENARVRRSALLCIGSVATACGSGTVAGLLKDNADYLVDSISLRLRHIQRYPEAPNVLQVAIRYGDQTILPLVNDLMMELLNVLDQHHAEHALSFMNVLCSFSTTIASDSSDDSSKPDKVRASFDCFKPEPTSVNPSADEIYKYYTDYRKQKEIANQFSNECGDDNRKADTDCELDESEDPFGDTEEKKILPDHIKLVIEILKRCQHLLMSVDAKLRLVVLETIAQSCLAMRSFKDDLLPVVHCLWKPFLHRFTDAEPVVAIKAFETFRVLAETCGDFVHRRFVEDVIPQLTTSLSKLAQSSVKAGPSYQYTQACKLQQCVLSNLGPLCLHSQVKELQLCQLLHACLPYLSARQPTCLQQACVEAFRYFITIDSDNVWLLLNDVYCPMSPLSSNVEYLPAIQMAGSKKRNEFTDNVVELMKLL